MSGLRVLRVEHHRNGVAGEGFCAVSFEDGGEQMLAVVFPSDGTSEDTAGIVRYSHQGAARVAVFRVADLPCVAFGVNSWRGDMYAAELYAAIEAYEARRAGVSA